MHTVIRVLGSWIVVLAAVISPAVLAAAPPAHPPTNSPGLSTPLPDEELDEVIVDGVRLKPTGDTRKISGWLGRLVGRFILDGQVDLHGHGASEDVQAISGSADCVGAGPAPAVRCEIHVRWQPVRGPGGKEIVGGSSNLDPAMMLFGLESQSTGIRYMLVDSNGVADATLGQLFGDTLMSRTRCVNIPDKCVKTTRILAAPDLNVVTMSIDLEIDFKKVASFTFAMSRVANPAAIVEPSVK